MLTIGRQAEEWTDLFLPDGRVISILVSKIQGQHVRLSIVAPEDVKVMRRELVGNPFHPVASPPAFADPAGRLELMRAKGSR